MQVVLADEHAVELAEDFGGQVGRGLEFVGRQQGVGGMAWSPRLVFGFRFSVFGVRDGRKK